MGTFKGTVLSLRPLIRRAVEEATQEVVDHLKETIEAPVSRQGYKVIRSLPDEPPMRDKGDYWASIFGKVVIKGNKITATIESSMKKRSRYLERGTGRMAPRPHIAPIRRLYAGGLFGSIVKQKLVGIIAGSK